MHCLEDFVLQQYRLCGEDAIYLIFWIAPFHFRAGIKRVSICERSWEKIEVLHRLEWKGNCSSKPQSSVSPTNLCDEKLICTFFPGKASFSVDNFFVKFDFQQVWNFSIWFPDQKRKRSGKRPLRYWGVVSEISQNVQISYFLSDPGPIIVYPCQWLTHSLTDDLVEDLMNWPLLMESNI